MDLLNKEMKLIDALKQGDTIEVSDWHFQCPVFMRLNREYKNGNLSVYVHHRLPIPRNPDDRYKYVPGKGFTHGWVVNFETTFRVVKY